MNLESSHVLIAEDHPVSRHLLARNLGMWGFRVTAVGDGESALKVLDGEDSPVVAILDWTIPLVDGLDVCRRVRAQNGRPFTYLLMLTARSEADDFATAFEAGFDDYLTKPFEADELRARVKVALRVVALERELAARNGELLSAQAELEKLRAGRS